MLSTRCSYCFRNKIGIDEEICHDTQRLNTFFSQRPKQPKGSLSGGVFSFTNRKCCECKSEGGSLIPLIVTT